MIDTHAHLDGGAFAEDRESVIEKAFSEGLEYIIIPAIEPQNFDAVLSLSNAYDKVYCGIGIHPHHAAEVSEDQINSVREIALREKKVKAIGEIGLDYFYDFAPKDVQKELFRKQLKIAKELDLPAIIHNRDSDDDLLAILEEEQDGTLNAVLHCFSGDVRMLEKCLELGFYVSFTGNITFKKSNLSEVVQNAPLNKIFLETDCPYMTPVPYRGKRNEPALVKLVAEKISEIKSLSLEEVIQMTTNQAKKFFRLLAFILFFSLSFGLLSAQNDDDSLEADKDKYNPFEKFIGFNPTIGINTIVQTITFTKVGGEKDISYEGIPLFGGGITYGLFDFLLLKADYIYSKNPEAKKKMEGVGDDFHHFYEFRSIWLANPYSTVNFFASVGGTYISSLYNKGNIEKEQKRSTFALNSGIGMNVNLNLKKYGLLNFMAEWMLHFDLSSRYVPKYEDFTIRVPREAEESTYFSMPRLSIIYYPPFKKQALPKPQN